MKIFGKIMLNVWFVLSIMFFLWLFLSWVDVNAHNMTDQMFHPWNFFVLFF